MAPGSPSDLESELSLLLVLTLLGEQSQLSHSIPLLVFFLFKRKNYPTEQKFTMLTVMVMGRKWASNRATVSRWRRPLLRVPTLVK